MLTNDSLQELLQTAEDSKKIDILMQIAENKLSVLDYSGENEIFEAQELAKLLKLNEKSADIKILLGEYKKVFGSFNESFENIYDAIRYYRKSNLEHKLTSAFIALSETYRVSSDYAKALKYAYEAQSIAHRFGNNNEKARAKNRIAAVYYEYMDEQDNFEKALKFANLSMELINSDNPMYLNNLNIIAACYMGKRMFDSSEYYFKKALVLAEETEDQYNYPTILVNLCNLYQTTKQYKKAIEFGLKSYEFTLDKNITYMNLYLYQMLIISYTAIENHKEANKFHGLANELKDHIFQSKKEYLAYDLENKHQLEQKKRDLKEEKSKTLSIFIIALVSVILLLGIIIIYFSKEKALSKKNKLITSQFDELHKLNATKDRFFSIIAHDLRNPISSYKSITEMMYSDYDSLNDEERKELLAVMKSSSESVAELLENLLYWSRSQRGVITFTPEEVNLCQLISMTTNLLEGQAANKSIDLIIECPQSLRACVDMNMFNTIIRNLVSNAIKFTEEKGKITISAQPNNDNVEVSIADTGVGMPKEKLEKLFKIEENVTTLGTGSEKGTGLGLIISQEFVEKHGGELIVESEEGVGTTFKFNIPTS